MKVEINKEKVKLIRYFPDNDFSKANLRGVYAKSATGIGAQLDRKTKRPKTGLEDWKPADIAKFEEELGLEAGSLTNRNWWAEFEILIPERGKVLNLKDSALDRLEYIVLKQRNDVAENLEELRNINSSAREALFLMTNDEDMARSKNKRTDFKRKAYKLMDDMSSEEMKDVLVFLGKSPYNMSSAMLEEKIGDEIELNAERFCGLFENDLFKDTIFINKCIHYGILSKRGSAILQDGSVISTTVEGAINFFNEPANQSMKLALLHDLNENDKLIGVNALSKSKTKVK